MNQVKIKIPHGKCFCTFYNNGKADVMIIDNVEVEEQFRRKGRGRELIKKAIELAKDYKVDSIELNVNRDNLPAIKLYEKMGFIKTDKIYYRKLL